MRTGRYEGWNVLAELILRSEVCGRSELSAELSKESLHPAARTIPCDAGWSYYSTRSEINAGNLTLSNFMPRNLGRFQADV